MCLDDKGVRDLIPELSRQVVTYGRHADADYRLDNYRSAGLCSHFELICPRSAAPLALTVNMPGLHNAQNAAGAAALCAELGISEGAIVKGLAEFGGVGRRFSDLGDVRWSAGSARLIDDYGHHPTEVAVTLQAARDAFHDQRVVMVYQPHRFTRTRDHFDEFVSVLGEAQFLICSMFILPANRRLRVPTRSHWPEQFAPEACWSPWWFPTSGSWQPSWLASCATGIFC